MSWSQVTRENPCAICGKPDWCTRTEDGSCCMRTESDRTMRNGGWFHRFEKNFQKRLNENGFRTVQCPTGFDYQLSASVKHLPSQECEKMLSGWSAMTNGQIGRLSYDLGLPESTLRDLDCVWAQEHRAWAFPMRDEVGLLTGFRLRGSDGKKFAIKGSKAGLFIPLGVMKRLPVKRVFICEGPTDTAALLSVGLFAIGRPACLGQEETVTELLRNLGTKEAVLVTDNDAPGLRGAEKLAQRLPCRSTMFCPPAKDARAFINGGGTSELISSMIAGSLWRTL